MQPGDTITPGPNPPTSESDQSVSLPAPQAPQQPASPQAPPAPRVPQAPPAPQAPAVPPNPQTPPAPQSPQAPQVAVSDQSPAPQSAPSALPAPQEESASFDEPKPRFQPESTQEPLVSWTASEYLIHHKTPGWFLLLGLGGAVLVGFVWLITRDTLSVVAAGVVAVVFGIAAARQPSSVNYSLTTAGLRIGDRFYNYVDFKSFSIVKEGPISSIMLMPLKRFWPSVSIYYPPDQEQQILDTLALYLPKEDRKPDAIDRLLHKVRY